MTGGEFGSLAARVREFDAILVPRLSDARILMRDLLAEVEKLEYALGAAKLTPVQFGPDGLVYPIELTAEPVISLRDHFAGLAIALIAGQADLDNTGPVEWSAACYEMADAMLAERAKAGG